MTIDRKFLIWSLGYVILGMALGIFMAMTNDHGQHVTHAHILLVGFLLSLVYGIIHRLWLDGPRARMATTQFYLHQAGVIVMVVGLFLLYGNLIDPDVIGPVLGVSSILVLSSALLMFWMVLRPASAVAAQAG